MLVKEKTSLPEIDFVKIVADIERSVLAMGCELHLDCADELLSNGSSYANLWGANIYPEDKRIDYISMINIRPQAGNRSMEIQNQAIREKVRAVIDKLLF